MAEAVVEGAKQIKNVDVELMIDMDATPEDLVKADAILVGIPTYHHDMPRDIKNLFEEAAVQGVDLKGKIGVSFGSYGWSGEAPRLTNEIMENKFGMTVLKPPLLIKYAPNTKALDECRRLGKKVADTVTNP